MLRLVSGAGLRARLRSPPRSFEQGIHAFSTSGGLDMKALLAQARARKLRKEESSKGKPLGSATRANEAIERALRKKAALSGTDTRTPTPPAADLTGSQDSTPTVPGRYTHAAVRVKPTKKSGPYSHAAVRGKPNKKIVADIISSSSEPSAKIDRFLHYHRRLKAAEWLEMLSYLVQENCLPEMQRLFPELLEECEAGNLGMSTLEKGYYQYMKLLASCGDVDEVTSLHDQLRDSATLELTSHHSICVLRAMAEAGQTDRLMSFAASLELDDNGFGVLIGYFAKQGDYVAVDNLLLQMDERDIRPTVRVVRGVMRACVDAGKVDKLWGYLERVATFPHRMRSVLYDDAFVILSTTGRSDEVFRLFGALRVNGERLGHKSYFYVIRACPDDADLLDKVVEDMEVAGVRPDMGILRACTQCYTADAGMEEDRLREAFRRLLELSGEMPGPTTRIPRDDARFARAFHCVIRWSGKKGKPAMMREYFERMMSYGLQPDEAVLTIMMDSYGKLGMNAEMLSVFEMMQKLGVKPDHVCYTSLMSNYTRQGDMPEVMKYYKEAFELEQETKSGDSGIHDTLITAAKRAGDPTMCKKVYSSMREGVVSAPELYTIDIMLQMCADHNLVDDAVELLQDVERFGVQADDNLLSAFTMVLARGGRIADAASFVELVVPTVRAVGPFLTHLSQTADLGPDIKQEANVLLEELQGDTTSEAGSLYGFSEDRGFSETNVKQLRAILAQCKAH